MKPGGCFCGTIRYEIGDGDYTTANCHCTMCRRTSGAPYVTWLVVPKGEFRYTAGEVTVLESSNRGTRYFCNRCGTPVACVTVAHPDVVDVTLGSLDAPEAFTPTFEVYTDTRLPWVHQRD